MRTDTDRLKFLAGCGSDDGPIIEGFANVLDEFWCYLGDAARDRVGEAVYCRDDFEANDTDKLEGFRRMIDAAIDDTDRNTFSAVR
jgi:hypothetical protein